MRIRTTLWLIAVAGCVALGIWQKDNLSAILREYISIRRDMDYSNGYAQFRKPIISGRIAQIDPEAAAVVELTIGDSNTYEDLNFLADSTLKFPSNRFFPYGVAHIVARDPYWGLDPQIPIVIARRLSQIEPNNAIHHYLAAEAMFVSRRGNDLENILAELEQANKCPEYRYPYDDYRSRADQILEKAKLSRIFVKQYSWAARWQFHNHLLWRSLLQYANASFTNNDYPIAIRISDDLKKVFDHLEIGRFPYSYDYQVPLVNIFSQRYSIEEIELQRATISKERARENRLRLCARLAVKIETERQIEKPVQQSKLQISDGILMPSAITTVHLSNMLLAIPVAILFILLFCLVFSFGAEGQHNHNKYPLFCGRLYSFLFCRQRHLNCCGI